MVCEVARQVFPCKSHARVLPVKHLSAHGDPTTFEFLTNGGNGLLLRGFEHEKFRRWNSPPGEAMPGPPNFKTYLLSLTTNSEAFLRVSSKALVREAIARNSCSSPATFGMLPRVTRCSTALHTLTLLL